jgi:DNA-binding CsgD family transcriptional regulator
VASASPGNPYESGERARLDTGLYCETVMAQRSCLLVRDARTDPDFDRNPDLRLGMAFYLGFPLLWPDGDVFGTICVLDDRENAGAILYEDLLSEFRGIIEADLRYLVEISERRRAEAALEEIRDQLERRVSERTARLDRSVRGLRREIARRRQVEAALKERERELEAKTIRLEEINAALKVLLQQRDRDRGDLEKQILSNINEMVFPYLHKLKLGRISDRHRAYVKILESNLNDIVSPFSHHVSSRLAKLTPTEMQVLNLVRQGKRTKEIAGILNTATSTVDFHRNNIRRKIGIRNSGTNLRTFVNSL